MNFFDYVDMLKNYKGIAKADLTAPEVDGFVDFLVNISKKALHYKTDIKRFTSFVDDFKYYLSCYEEKMDSASLDEIENSAIVDDGMKGLKYRAMTIADVLLNDCFTNGYFE